jgi:hypothetical protein
MAGSLDRLGTSSAEVLFSFGSNFLLQELGFDKLTLTFRFLLIVS